MAHNLRNILINLAGILIAFLLGAVVMIFQGYNPLETYEALFGYSLGNTYSFMTVLKNSVPLILTGLSASVAFASGPVNLGQPGQLLMGALFATVGGLYVNLPSVLMIPFLLVSAMVGGALWSGIAGLLKRLFNMDEYITTLMMNMIADFFTYWAITYPFFEKNANHPRKKLYACNAINRCVSRIGRRFNYYGRASSIYQRIGSQLRLGWNYGFHGRQ